MTTIIATIENCEVTLNVDDQTQQEIVTYTAKAAIDGDGSGGNSYNDPCFQPDTTLHNEGQALNSEVDQYLVVPPAIIQNTRGIVLGCKATIEYNGILIDAVVGDIGPHLKIGEISIASARALNIPSSPINGGEDNHVVKYTLWPGVPANVNGTQYTLQAR